MTTLDWLPVGMAVAGYLLGSIPFGVIVAKCLGAVDPRTAGSRNIGFTNVLRVSGKKAGLLTLAGDIGKGWLVGWAALHTLDQEAAVLGVTLCPILGHLHSVFLRFQGGKGVATAMGAVAGVAPAIGLTMLAVWLATAAIWRYSSGAALAAFAALPVMAVAFGHSAAFQVFAWLVSGMITFRHKENIRRLWQGIESKIGQSNIDQSKS
ncbi:MAG: glycerol-3-phosphate 1-O-acyltransferase [Nitrospirae bacterium]|nr:MAG: glycerol-3-phosphate 1-O-acyltransferase [Nitrospirota bacterium]